MNDIEELISGLSWNKPSNIQEKSIKLLAKYPVDILPPLITNTGKDHWLNAVKVYQLIGYSEINKAINQLLFLFKDMNWPGAREAAQLLKNIDQEKLIFYIEQSLDMADDTCDTIWIAGIKEFISNNDLEDKFIKYQEILESAEW